MPIPKPSKGEKEKDFISRCMGSEVMTKEYPENDQRAAVCYSSWRDRNKSPKASEVQTAQQICANIDMTQVQKKKYKGREYYVAPVIMAKECVMNGIFYPSEELEKFPGAWDGRPVTLFHPKNADGDFISANDSETSEDIHFGFLRNTKYDDGLRANSWLDIEHAKKVRPEVLEYYEGKKDRLEVSTGLWGDIIPVKGKHEEDHYDGIMTNIRPDHLALLPGGEGACNWETGCGLRVNDDGNPDGDQEHGLGDIRLIEIQRIDFLLANMTDADLKSAIYTALHKSNSAFNYYLEMIELDKKYIVYSRYSKSNTSEIEPELLLKQEYLIDDGQVTLTGTAIEVKREVIYKEIKKGEINEMSDKLKAKVDALIACEHCKYTEANREWLMTLNEEQLELISPAIPEPATPAPVVNEPIKKEETPKTFSNAQEWLQAQEGMPKDIKDHIMDGLALNAMQRAELIESITKDPRNTFTNEDLHSKTTGELKALSAFTRPLPESNPKPAEFFGMRVVPGGLQPNSQPTSPEPMQRQDLTEAFKANRK